MLLLKLCCSNMLVLLLKLYSVLLLCSLKDVDFPVCLENPMGLGERQKASPAHGDRDGDRLAIFSYGWVWGGKTWWVSSSLQS